MCLAEQFCNAFSFISVISDFQDFEEITFCFLVNRSTVFLPFSLTIPFGFSHCRASKQAQSRVDWMLAGGLMRMSLSCSGT